MDSVSIAAALILLLIAAGAVALVVWFVRSLGNRERDLAAFAKAEGLTYEGGPTKIAIPEPPPVSDYRVTRREHPMIGTRHGVDVLACDLWYHRWKSTRYSTVVAIHAMLPPIQLPLGNHTLRVEQNGWTFLFPCRNDSNMRRLKPQEIAGLWDTMSAAASRPPASAPYGGSSGTPPMGSPQAPPLQQPNR